VIPDVGAFDSVLCPWWMRKKADYGMEIQNGGWWCTGHTTVPYLVYKFDNQGAESK
jgi:hypothetical protein